MSDLHVDGVLIEAKPVTSCAIRGSDVLVLPCVPLDRAVEIASVSDHRTIYLLDSSLVEEAFPLGEKGVPPHCDGVLGGDCRITPADDVEIPFQDAVCDSPGVADPGREFEIRAELVHSRPCRDQFHR